MDKTQTTQTQTQTTEQDELALVITYETAQWKYDVALLRADQEPSVEHEQAYQAAKATRDAAYQALLDAGMVQVY